MIGQGAVPGVRSYLALFIESTYGTFPATVATGASTLEPLSFGFKTEIVDEKLDAISRNRGFTKRVQLDKTVAGPMEQYLHPEESPILLALAMGGGIVSSSLTAGAFTHSISAGDFSSTIQSLSIHARKGSATHFQYTGGRINVMKISANVGELVRASYEFIFKDSTQSGADISSSLSISANLPFTYVQGTYNYAATEASLTSTVEEQITGFELTLNNNLISDQNVRKLGSNVLQTLPGTRRDVEFKISQRFDTVTAWNRFIANTQGSAELVFQGASITAEANFECRIILPKIFVDTPDVDVTGSNEILMSEINFAVLVDDPSTSTGREIGITVINSTSSY